MSFKIMIERTFKEPVNADILKIIDDIRVKALRQRGYIGGETMVNVENDRDLLVISLWSNVDDWKTWYDGKDWKEQEKQLVPHLAGPVRVRAYMPGADYKKDIS